MKKHLFYVTNFISFNNYLTIIKEKKLNIEDCIFYSPRKINSLISLKKELRFVAIESIQLIESKRQIIKNRLKFYSFNKKTNCLLNHKFYNLYTPHLINYRERLLLLNKKCIGYYFVEEGMPAYRSDFKIHPDQNVTSLKFAKVHNLMPLGIDYSKYKGSFGTNNYAYNWMPNKNKIDLNFNHKQCDKISLSDKYNNILGIDSPNSFSDFSVYLKCINALLLEVFVDRKMIIYLKFHPDYSVDFKLKNEIIQIFKSYYQKYEILKNDFFIEQYVQTRNNVKFYNINSSLIIYVLISGNEVFQFGSKFKKDDKKLEYSINLIQDTLRQMQLNLTKIY